VPSTAANTTGFWSAETFDEATIDRELDWGAGLGFNSCRVFVQYLVWKHDPAGLKPRLDKFLALAGKHSLTATLVLFDDCAFGDALQTEPYLGQQREPIPGMTLIHKVGPDCGLTQALVNGQPAATAQFDTYWPTVEWNHRTVLTTGRDGSALAITCSATHGLAYAYGPTNGCTFQKETKLNANGTSTSEWTMALTDFAGRPYQTLYADNRFTLSLNNSFGQLYKLTFWR
jgi:hypothetical protein